MADKRIPIEKFLPLYLKAAEEGVTKEDFAKKIGLKPSTVYQRVYELRANGADLPLLKTAGRIPLNDKVQAILAEYQGGNGKAKAKPAKKIELEDEDMEDQCDPLADILGG
jgi:transposase